MSEDTTHSDSGPFWSHDDSDTVTELFHARFESGPDELVIAIVETVAAVTDQEAVAMDPLFETVDAEALTELLQSSRERDQPVSATFFYQGCRVTVSSPGDIVIEAPEQ